MATKVEIDIDVEVQQKTAEFQTLAQQHTLARQQLQAITARMETLRHEIQFLEGKRPAPPEPQPASRQQRRAAARAARKAQEAREPEGEAPTPSPEG
jgi:hypothetical protein